MRRVKFSYSYWCEDVAKLTDYTKQKNEDFFQSERRNIFDNILVEVGTQITTIHNRKGFFSIRGGINLISYCTVYMR